MPRSTHVYEALANSSCIWECVSCGLPNFSSSLFESSTIQTTNYFWPLDSNLSDGSHSESILNQPQSTVYINTISNNKPSTQCWHRRYIKTKIKMSIKRKLSLLNINCQSVANKKDQPVMLRNNTKPDIVVGTESWLRPDIIKDNEIFPPNWTIYRCDRKTSKGGGVFIAISNCIWSQRQYDLETDCEMIWVKLCVVGCKDLYICSYYRPNASEKLSLECLNESLNRISHKNCHLWLAGDFNLPGFDWSTGTIK